ncbi:MAG TPA: hypothetical protein VK927_00485 [Adhaeribacter sp.]|nr:hypothetical protein [Adhaeribacter sp.]
MAEHTNWREQIGIGLAQTFLAAIVIFIYFVVWNFRVLNVIKREKQRGAKYLNIGLILLFPGLVVGSLLYWQIQKGLVKNTAKNYLAPVPYGEIYHTPNKLTGIRGFRPTPDSLLILTWRSKVIDPQKIYQNEDEEVHGQSFNQEPIENSEELFSLKNGHLKRVAVQHDYLQFREYNFKGWAKCLQAFINTKQEQYVYRYDNCTQEHLLKPHLSGYSPGYRSSTINYEVGRELFFITTPLYSDHQKDSFFYVARINDREAKVYRIDLSNDPELKKEFKNSFAHVHLFATTQHIYLVSRFRILEIRL